MAYDNRRGNGDYGRKSYNRGCLLYTSDAADE